MPGMSYFSNFQTSLHAKTMKDDISGPSFKLDIKCTYFNHLKNY